MKYNFITTTIINNFYIDIVCLKVYHQHTNKCLNQSIYNINQFEFQFIFLLRQNIKLSENYPLTDTLKVHKVAHSTIVITF